MTVHICTVCFMPVTEHRDDEHWPPRCCKGCHCGTGETREAAEDDA